MGNILCGDVCPALHSSITSNSSVNDLLCMKSTAVKLLINRFNQKIQTDYNWSINEKQFYNLYDRLCGDRDVLYKYWCVWSSNNQQSTVNVLCIFAASIVCCHSTYHNKVSQMFNLFDLDMNGSITKDEMTIIIHSIVNGIFTVTHQLDGVPTMDQLQMISQRVFSQADRSVKYDGKISLDELLLFCSADSDAVKLLGTYNTSDIIQVKSKLNKQQQLQSQNKIQSKASVPTFTPVKLKLPAVTSPIRSHTPNNNTNTPTDSTTLSAPKPTASRLPSIDLDDIARYTDLTLQIKQLFDYIDCDNTGFISLQQLAHTCRTERGRIDLCVVLPTFTLSQSVDITVQNNTNKNSSQHKPKIQSTVARLDFKSVLRIFLPQCRPGTIDRLVQTVQFKPVTQPIIHKICSIYDSLDTNFTGSVLYIAILQILNTSAKLKHYITIPSVQSIPDHKLHVTLHELMRKLFDKTHSSQLSEILSWAKPSKTLTTEQRNDLKLLFQLYDIDGDGVIVLDELKQCILSNLPDSEAALMFQQFDLDGDKQIDLHEYVLVYDTIHMIQFYTNTSIV